MLYFVGHLNRYGQKGYYCFMLLIFCYFHISLVVFVSVCESGLGMYEWCDVFRRTKKPNDDYFAYVRNWKWVLFARVRQWKMIG